MKHLKTAWRYIRRAPFQSLSALLVMATNFLLVSFFAFLLIGASTVISYLEGRPVVEAFLNDGFDQAQVDQLADDVEAIEGVRKVRFISKQEAFDIYKKDNQDDPLLLEMVTPEILPASIEVSADKPAVLHKVAEKLKTKSGMFLEIVFQKDVVEQLTGLVNLLRNIGLFLTGFLTLVSALVIMVVTGMKVTLKRKDIGVLKLLGAGDFYAQLPFLIEGLSYGLFGALLGWGLTFLVFWQLRPHMAPFFGSIPFYPSTIQPFLFVLLLEGVGGALVGLLSSFFSVRRHFKK